jgi:cbb3-type cytochrome oxidase subunit 3
VATPFSWVETLLRRRRTMRTMHQASILMTFFVGLMGVVWYALETGVFDREVGQAAQMVVAASDSGDKAVFRFSAKADAEDLAN